MFDSDEDFDHNCPECEDLCDCGEPDDCLWCSTCFDPDFQEEDDE